VVKVGASLLIRLLFTIQFVVLISYKIIINFQEGVAMDLTSAVGKHAEWKTKFRSAITKKEQMDSVTKAKDNCCELGKWLHGEAKSQFGAMVAYKECVEKHAVFHTEAAKVASAINAKKYTEAEAMLDGGTSYAKISSAVGVAIMHLKKEAGL
jgi:hypothetical protein